MLEFCWLLRISSSLPTDLKNQVFSVVTKPTWREEQREHDTLKRVCLLIYQRGWIEGPGLKWGCLKILGLPILPSDENKLLYGEEQNCRCQSPTATQCCRVMPGLGVGELQKSTLGYKGMKKHQRWWAWTDLKRDKKWSWPFNYDEHNCD